jgi:hypothetical protein
MDPFKYLKRDEKGEGMQKIYRFRHTGEGIKLRIPE